MKLSACNSRYLSLSYHLQGPMFTQSGCVDLDFACALSLRACRTLTPGMPARAFAKTSTTISRAGMPARTVYVTATRRYTRVSCRSATQYSNSNGLLRVSSAIPGSLAGEHLRRRHLHPLHGPSGHLHQKQV